MFTGLLKIIELEEFLAQVIDCGPSGLPPFDPERYWALAHIDEHKGNGLHPRPPRTDLRYVTGIKGEIIACIRSPRQSWPSPIGMRNG